jgi:phage terminase small subunit
MAEMTTPNIFTMPQTGGNNDMGMGAITPLILGAALFGGRGGLFGNNNDGAAVAAAAVERGATVAEVQGIVNGITAMQDIGSARREIGKVEKEIWQAEGDLQAAVTASGSAVQNQVLQSQIASMQGQSNIINSIDSHTAQLEIGQAATNAALAAGFAATALAAKDAVIDGLRNTQIITANADNNTKDVLAAIANLKDTLPNSRELELQRQVGVLQGELFNSTTQGAIRASTIEVNQTVNQNNLQNQQQQQMQSIVGVLNGLVGELQRNTQQTIAIGSTLTGNAQTSTNNRVNG